MSVCSLQMLINYICPSITYLINCCRRQGVMPKIWKSAKVTALFKSVDKKNMNNFKPISILPAISKVIESVVFEHLHHYLLENNLLSQKQFSKIVIIALHKNISLGLRINLIIICAFIAMSVIMIFINHFPSDHLFTTTKYTRITVFQTYHSFKITNHSFPVILCSTTLFGINSLRIFSGSHGLTAQSISMDLHSVIFFTKLVQNQ